MMLLLNNDSVGDKALPESQEKVVKLTTLMLNLIVRLLLLLMDVSTVLLLILSGVFCVVRGNVLCVVMGNVLLMVLSDVLCVINGTVLLMKLSTVDLVVFSDILGVVLGMILFNGLNLCMIHFFGYIFLLCRIMSFVQMCGNILCRVGSDILLSKSLLSFWHSLSLEKVFGSVNGLIVLLFDFDALFDNIRDFLCLRFWLLSLFDSFDKRF